MTVGADTDDHWEAGAFRPPRPRRRSILTFSALGVLALCGGVALGLVVLPVFFQSGDVASVLRQDGPVVAVVVIALGLGYYFGVQSGWDQAERAAIIHLDPAPFVALSDPETFSDTKEPPPESGG